MKCIITVLGTDKVGIIAKVCTYLSEVNINILDISQTIVSGYFNMMMIVSGYFNMMMIVDADKASKSLEAFTDDLIEIGNNLGVKITVQHEDIFNCMHRI